MQEPLVFSLVGAAPPPVAPHIMRDPEDKPCLHDECQVRPHLSGHDLLTSITLPNKHIDRGNPHTDRSMCSFVVCQLDCLPEVLHFIPWQDWRQGTTEWLPVDRVVRPVRRTTLRTPPPVMTQHRSQTSMR